jgi:hypothetical protein
MHSDGADPRRALIMDRAANDLRIRSRNWWKLEIQEIRLELMKEVSERKLGDHGQALGDVDAFSSAAL